MMRIAYVSTDPGIPAFGCKGASIHVQEMLRAFLQQGAEVTLFSPSAKDAPPSDLAGVRVASLPPMPKGDPEDRARGLLEMNGSLAEALTRNGPFDLIYERHALFAHAAMEWARRAGVPCTLEVNAPLIEEQRRHRTLALPSEAEHAARRAMAAANQVLAVSPGAASYAEGYGAAAPRVVPNAINPARFAKPARFEGPFTVGFLGTLKPWHDVTTLIDAMALLVPRLPEARLLIVGDGPERATLEVQVAEFALTGATTFTGALAPADVPAMLRRMHVGVAPYSAGDPFYFSPLKIYEYMASGLPVVASRVGDLDRVIAQGATGQVVPPDDPEALAGALLDLAQAPHEAQRMGAAARTHVFAHHTWDSVAAGVLRGAGLALAGAA